MSSWDIGTSGLQVAIMNFQLPVRSHIISSSPIGLLDPKNIGITVRIVLAPQPSHLARRSQLWDYKTPASRTCEEGEGEGEGEGRGARARRGRLLYGRTLYLCRQSLSHIGWDTERDLQGCVSDMTVIYSAPMSTPLRLIHMNPICNKRHSYCSAPFHRSYFDFSTGFIEIDRYGEQNVNFVELRRRRKEIHPTEHPGHFGAY